MAAPLDTALVVGGTRFLGRHLVTELLDHDYDVTLFNRGEHENPFAADDRVAHVAGDRRDDDRLREAAARVGPDAVFDCVAYHPGDVETAVDAFADAEAYVYVSSGAAYRERAVPTREADPLVGCTDEQATDESHATYPNRKAEGDRVVAASPATGVRTASVRPVLAYGAHDYTERFDYWMDRANRFDRVVVPGDGDSLLHHSYAPDVASALRIVAERGDHGEAYNVADDRAWTLETWVERFAAALDADVEVVHASERALAAADLSPGDFVYYTTDPFVADVGKLRGLGWQPTPMDAAVEAAVEAHLASDRDGSDHDPGRAAEEAAVEAVADGS